MVRAGENSFRLSPPFAALVAGVSGMDLSTVLAARDLACGRAGQSALPPERRDRLDGAQALTVALDAGVRPSAAARELYAVLYRSLPEFAERLEAGGPLLDVGSGVGGTPLTMFERLRAIGVEIVPGIAEEIRRRAKAAGAEDQLEVRAMDARALDDECRFPVSFWTQPFFPAETRAEVLAAILRPAACCWCRSCSRRCPQRTNRSWPTGSTGGSREPLSPVHGGSGR